MLWATLQIVAIEKNTDKTSVTASYQDTVINCVIPFVDDASIENAINCWCTLLHLQVSNQEIALNC